MQNNTYPTFVIQNVDRNIKAKDYEQFGDDLLVTSWFRTIQGEGPYAGYPSIFVRLAGCNFGEKSFNCRFCDTSFQFDQGQRISIENLLETIIKIPGYAKSDVLVITGGEPTLQKNLIPFMLAAQPYFQDIQIETNGTQASFFQHFAEAFAVKVNRPYICVSPKASYGARRYAQLSPTVLDNAHCLKFVVSADPESPHHTIPEWAFEWQRRYPANKLYVSPMAEYARAYQGEVSSIWEDGLIDKQRTAANYAYAAQYAMKHHVLLSLQTHLFTAIP